MTIILFADSGSMIYAHTCLKSNRKSFSLYKPAHCATEQTKQHHCCSKKKVVVEDQDCIVGKKGCCAVSSTFVKTSFPTNVIEYKQTEAGKDIVVQLPLQVAFTLNPQFLSAGVLSHGPPLPVTDIQTFTGVFRI